MLYELSGGSGLSGAGEPSAFPGAVLLAPATQRNRDPILAVLRRVLPATGTVLEIASGTGEHAVHFAKALPRLTWQPTDRNAECPISAVVKMSVDSLCAGHGVEYPA